MPDYLLVLSTFLSFCNYFKTGEKILDKNKAIFKEEINNTSSSINFLTEELNAFSITLQELKPVYDELTVMKICNYSDLKM